MGSLVLKEVDEGDVLTPAAGKSALFIDGTDVKVKLDTGTVVVIGNLTGGVTSVTAGDGIAADAQSGGVVEITNLGVLSVNNLTGEVTLQAGDGIVITPQSGGVLLLESDVVGGVESVQVGSEILQGALVFTGQGVSRGSGNQLIFEGGGSTWHSVVGVPEDSLGIDGDFALDAATGDYYTKEAGSWALTGNLQGPAGADGSDGDDGASVGTYLVSGATIAWQTGYQYLVGAATYYLSGVLTSSLEQDVTLDAADPTNDRIDVLVLDASGVLSAIAGTPSASPAEPSIDPAVYLRLGIVLVQAGTTEPPLTETEIYRDNAEWTAAASAGTINVDSTSNPRSGTKDIEGTSVAANTYVTLTKPAAGTTDLAGEDTLVFYVRVKAAWPTNKAIRLGWYDGATLRGSNVTIGNGQLGFDSSLVGSYQQIVVPIANFAVPAGQLVTTLRMTIVGGGANVGFYIDDILLQAGVPTGTAAIWRWRGTWSALVTYNRNDVVALDGSSYVALITNQAVSPDTATVEWALVAQKGADGEGGGADIVAGSGIAVDQLSGNTKRVRANLAAGTGVTLTEQSGNVLEISAEGGAEQTPFYVPVGETYTVEANKQVLFAEAIEVDGTLEVDGILVAVDGAGPQVITDSSASRTVSLADVGNIIQMTYSGSGAAQYVLDDPAGEFPIGQQAHLFQIGTAPVMIYAPSGVQLYAAGGIYSRAQGSPITVLKLAANTWVAFGDTSSS